MVKFLKSILLISAVLVSSWYNSLVLTFFESNQSYFAKELCEQKEITGNTCQGSCQLRALLQTEEEHEAPFTPSFSEELEFLNSFSPAEQNLFLSFNQEKYFEWYSIRLCDGIKRLIWRPPGEMV